MFLLVRIVFTAVIFLESVDIFPCDSSHGMKITIRLPVGEDRFCNLHGQAKQRF